MARANNRLASKLQHFPSLVLRTTMPPPISPHLTSHRILALPRRREETLESIRHWQEREGPYEDEAGYVLTPPKLSSNEGLSCARVSRCLAHPSEPTPLTPHCDANESLSRNFFMTYCRRGGRPSQVSLQASCFRAVLSMYQVLRRAVSAFRRLA